MTAAGILRALTPTEKIYADREIYVGYTVRAVGQLDLDALATAYEAVCRAYPQLAARLETGDGGPVLVDSGAPPEARICDGDPEDPLTGVELDQQRALSALNVVRDGAEASVALITHHSIADARHSLDALAALWSCYTDVVRGVPVDLPSHPYPRPLEDLLAERGIRRTAPSEAAAAEPLAAPNRPEPERFPLMRHVTQHRMTAAQSAALAELGHREQVTINGLLSGAVLLVEAEIRDLPLTDLLLRYTVNLRNRVTPQIGPAEGTNVVGGGIFKTGNGIEPDAVAIGRALGAQLRAGLADGSIQRSLLDMVSQPAPAAAAPGPRPAVVSMTNWGLVPPLRTPDELLLTNFRSAARIVRASVEDLTSSGGYVVNTFDGRVGIDLAWPEGDPEVPRRLDCLRKRLSRMVRRS
ncbi:phthiocerol/phthiodiolone dimycocerosyl transferase family protein [Streptomyces asiaticus]